MCRCVTVSSQCIHTYWFATRPPVVTGLVQRVSSSQDLCRGFRRHRTCAEGFVVTGLVQRGFVVTGLVQRGFVVTGLVQRGLESWLGLYFDWSKGELRTSPASLSRSSRAVSSGKTLSGRPGIIMRCSGWSWRTLCPTTPYVFHNAQLVIAFQPVDRLSGSSALSAGPRLHILAAFRQDIGDSWWWKGPASPQARYGLCHATRETHKNSYYQNQVRYKRKD